MKPSPGNAPVCQAGGEPRVGLTQPAGPPKTEFSKTMRLSSLSSKLHGPDVAELFVEASNASLAR